MKYGTLNLGQIEALVNIIGGIGVVESILKGSPDGLGNPEARAFLRSLDKCLAVRDLLRGQGDYGHEDGVSTFRIAASKVCDQVTNIAINAISGDDAIDYQEIKDEAIENVSLALRKLTEFEVREGGELIRSVEGRLKEIKKGLKGDDMRSVLKDACRLRGYLHGMEDFNDHILAGFDKANGMGGYKRSGK